MIKSNINQRLGRRSSEIVYPESDGEPMAANIVVIHILSKSRRI
ncbi:hypothetical protein U9R62_10820 [Cylindrospermopsis raciborskii DSH]